MYTLVYTKYLRLTLGPGQQTVYGLWETHYSFMAEAGCTFIDPMVHGNRFI